MSRRLLPNMLQLPDESNPLDNLDEEQHDHPRPTSFEQVVEAVRREREHQDRRWGTVFKTGGHSLAGWILIQEDHVSKLRATWTIEERAEVLFEMLQIAAIAMACLEQHGFAERAEP